MLQRWDASERLPLARQLPVDRQLVGMEPRPFRHEAKRARREIAVQHGKRAELDLRLAPRVVGMAADLGHPPTVASPSYPATGLLP